ncbi:bifunctional 6-Cysteine (6-Cys) domain/6-Cysteine (6-Cys) domain superfamily [Babesia duncani]|uniref:Bifunctional 6-Cysteine (6-Cys) domain/6-Cysteine (6-Cys) domain superfamily n=1 Tax=Babesia duncani TaxID=323732 RepID=A0AAD9UN77_9APIC|nr:bifunctional 6-Cysteine (6-Cys) domain/6-Cysteine (6-Cys) domain superfamily [Babesia duncani]
MVSTATIIGVVVFALANVIFGNLEICDFSPQGKLRPMAITFCKARFGIGKSTEIICPHSINGNSYTIFPKNTENEAYAYHYPIEGVDDFDSLHPTIYKNIYGSIKKQHASMVHEESVLKLALRVTDDEILVNHGPRTFLYICMKEDTEADDDFIETIKAHLSNGRRIRMRHNRRYEMIPNVPIEFVNDGIGIVEVISMAKDTITHGCGDVPTNLFLNKADYDSETQSYSCEVDIINTPNVGFLCKGKLDPPDCIYRFYNMENELFTDGSNYYTIKKYRNDMYGTLLYGYFNEYVNPGNFFGKCYCRNVQTNEITATIVFKHRTEHLCSINMMLFSEYLQFDKWCDFKIHPGESVKITFLPENGFYDEDEEEYFNDPGSEDDHYVSTLVPKDVKSHCHWRVEHLSGPFRHGTLDQVLGVDVIEVDDTDRANGIIIINYKRPWSDNNIHNAHSINLVYCWRMHHWDRPFINERIAIIMITLLRETHEEFQWEDD